MSVELQVGRGLPGVPDAVDAALEILGGEVGTALYDQS